MRPALPIALALLGLLFLMAMPLAAQEQDNELLAMEYGTVFGYDLTNEAMESGQEYSFLLQLSPEIEAGASFIQGTGVLNASFFRIDYAIGPASVQLQTGVYNAALGYGLGAEYVLLSRSFEGVNTQLAASLDYFTSSALGIDNGTVSVGIAASLGI
jgi:hypothetical protein